MNFKTIKVEIDGPLGRLTLNRPERLNAMNATMLRELVEAARWLDEQREARVVIVGGAGRAFCAGADLKESPTAEAVPDSGKSWLYRREEAQYGRRMADAIEQMRATTIVRLHGHIVGGGSCWPRPATCASRLKTRASRSLKSNSAFRWPGAPFLGWRAKSARP
jgi:enoyl-CoA hydratase/carnithine racemase